MHVRFHLVAWGCMQWMGMLIFSFQWKYLALRTRSCKSKSIKQTKISKLHGWKTTDMFDVDEFGAPRHSWKLPSSGAIVLDRPHLWNKQVLRGPLLLNCVIACKPPPITATQRLGWFIVGFVRIKLPSSHRNPVQLFWGVVRHVKKWLGLLT